MPGLPIWTGLILLRLLAALGLSALNRKETRRGLQSPPPAVSALFDAETRQKAADYTLAKSKFGSIHEIYSALVLIGVLASWALPWLYQKVSAWGAPGASWTGSAFIFLAFAGLAATSLPFDAWDQFKIEARFGFNRMSVGLWIADMIKQTALALVLGFPILWLLLALVRKMGSSWWLWGAGIVFAIQLVLQVAYPKLILPLFNKLKPLSEGELRSRLLALAERTGFRAGAIEVIDGSKRSAHANAYFTGFGRFRRIVLFDTLIQQMVPEELEAVLAHEIGHYRLGHVPRRIILSAFTLFAAFAVLAWLIHSPWFAGGLGFPPDSLAPAFLLFGLLGGTVTFWFTPLLAAWSRRHEFAADAFARNAMGAPTPLVSALRKLHEKNLGNLTPHPLFSAFYYSHPTLVERERALQQS